MAYPNAQRGGVLHCPWKGRLSQSSHGDFPFRAGYAVRHVPPCPGYGRPARLPACRRSPILGRWPHQWRLWHPLSVKDILGEDSGRTFFGDGGSRGCPGDCDGVHWIMNHQAGNTHYGNRGRTTVKPLRVFSPPVLVIPADGQSAFWLQRFLEGYFRGFQVSF